MTLLEVIIALSIFSMASLIVMGYIIQSYRVNRFAMQQADALEHARHGLEIMEKESREASFSDLGSYPIIAASDQTFAFYSNVDADSSVERVRYFLSDTEFKRGIIKPSGNPLTYAPANETLTTVAQYVRNGSDPVFYYYSGSFPTSTVPLTTPANPNQVKLVELKLQVNLDPLVAPDDITLDTYVQIRNVKDNL
ncbi:MAG: hypothetical protein PHI63_06145 [Patescibacteria group bacterium]|nr:hypothetical protein [Patescibacteria group bacterium]